MNSNYVRIDTNKLTSLVKNSKMNKTEFCRTIGHEGSYLKKCIDRGTMSLSDILLIKKIYECDIEYHPPKEEPQIIQGKQMSLDDMKKGLSHKDKAFYYHLLTEVWDVHFFLNHSNAGLDKDAVKSVRASLLKMMDNIEQILNVGDYMEAMNEI